MEEKILIKSQKYSFKKFFLTVAIVSVMLAAFWYLLDRSAYTNRCDKEYISAKSEYNVLTGELDSYFSPCNHDKSEVDTYDKFLIVHPDTKSFILCENYHYGWDFDIIYLLPLLLNVISLIIYFYLSSYSITVTDKRVYGKAAFGKQVDLPLDSISAIATSYLKGIAIGTSSGRIHFKLIKNQKEVHSTISELLAQRQSNVPKTTHTDVNTTILSNADELKKFKELLDSGVITQEEFDAKKKQLLGL